MWRLQLIGRHSNHGRLDGLRIVRESYLLHACCSSVSGDTANVTSFSFLLRIGSVTEQNDASSTHALRSPL